MSAFQVCLCGAAPGYPHKALCPRPLFNAAPGSPEETRWLEEYDRLQEKVLPDVWARRDDIRAYAREKGRN